MTRHFQHEIDRLKEQVLHLAAKVEANLRFAVQAVTERDGSLRDKVVEADGEIDRIEVEVEEECLKILALHQPVASDLRYVIAVLKINNDLERIGDLAVNIAKRAVILDCENPPPVPFDLPAMLALAVDMVRRSADALVESDDAVAEGVLQSDDELDDLHEKAYHAVEAGIASNPGLVGYFTSLLSVSRNLERIGDHATNIAEDVIYMVRGEIVRHGMGSRL